jgi:hypothetical protein
VCVYILIQSSDLYPTPLVGFSEAQHQIDTARMPVLPSRDHPPTQHFKDRVMREREYIGEWLGKGSELIVPSTGAPASFEHRTQFAQPNSIPKPFDDKFATDNGPAQARFRSTSENLMENTQIETPSNHAQYTHPHALYHQIIKVPKSMQARAAMNTDPLFQMTPEPLRAPPK